MSISGPSTVLAAIQLVFTDIEQVAVAGFPAGHGPTREAYALDLRQLNAWSM